MLPGDHTLTDPSLPAPFLWKMREYDTPLVDYERGGAGLGLANLGLGVQTWTLSYSAPDVVVTDEVGASTALFSRANITELALAFDQSMNAFVAFVESGQAKFWWFDTNTNQMTFTDLSTDAERPRCCLDDHRSVFVASSDIILAYMRGGDLCVRVQRERYQTEHVLKSNAAGTLDAIGMNTVNRLQFGLTPS